MDGRASNSVFKRVQQVILSDDIVVSPHLVNHIAAGEEGFVATQNSQPTNPRLPVQEAFEFLFRAQAETPQQAAGHTWLGLSAVRKLSL
ncbi:MAG: hypothetical protein WAM39_17265 [Bryobacteraceae bacterium]